MATHTRQLIASRTRRLETLVETTPAHAPNWKRRRDIPLAILAWIGLVAVVIWAASHVVRSLILLVIAALLAFALAPLVKLLQRIMPRLLAILVVYILVLAGLSVVIYFIVRTAIIQVDELSKEVKSLLDPNAPPTPLEATLKSFGIGATQIAEAHQLIIDHLKNLASDAAPILKSIFDFVLDILVVAMLSIYFLLDGSRVPNWLRNNLPLRQRERGYFLLDTLEKVVGGYIRGQLTLSILIGLLVGVGMAALQVPHPVLLGMLAFIFAFIPVLGTFVSAAACILLALTQTNSWVMTLTHSPSWVLAIIVLAYFIFVHAFEGHIVGPRIVGDSIGLHPIISIVVLIAGTELFGILGALFAAPIAGIVQAVLISLWLEWRANHPDQFPEVAEEVLIKSESMKSEVVEREVLVETNSIIQPGQLAN